MTGRLLLLLLIDTNFTISILVIWFRSCEGPIGIILFIIV